MAAACRVLVAALLYLALAGDGWAAERQVLRGHVPEAVSNLAPVGRLPGTQHLRLAIALPLRNEAGLAELLRQLYDPSSPRYRQYLKKGEAAAQFGPTEHDYEAVAAFAAAHNLKVTRRYDNRMLLDVDGAVSDIENALHVTMRVYRHPSEQRTFYAPDTDPSIDLPVPIAHISGLENYSLPKPRFDFTPAGVQAPNSGSGPSGNYIGNDFRAAYAAGVTLTGSGQSVALLQFDGYSISDIQTYETDAGLPNVTCTNVLLDGFNGTPATTNGQLEVSLDIEMVISMAPGVSKVILYEGGPNGDWHDLLNQIQSDDAASQVSCSWYSPGEPEDPVADSIFQLMASQGQSFYCASGDDDAYTGLLPFPEDTPYITEVGGTTLTTSGGGAPWGSETAWNWNNGTGTGGGISTQYSIPAWQKAILMNANAGSMTMRNTPDVALTGNNVYVYAGGKGYSVGGTSCASPLWAGFTALINQEAVANGYKTVGFINPAVYALASSSGYAAAFHDITTGNNTSTSSPNQFYATPGYDLCTGNGTPAGAALINALAFPPDSLELSFATFVTSGPVGGPFTSGSGSFTVTNSGTTSLVWSAGATQSWLSLSATGGTLAASGSTTVTATINTNANALASGTYYDTISFTDPATNYIQTRPVSLSVIAKPVITSALTATATSGSSFTYQIVASNGPTSYGASGLPSGLSFNSSTGVISGKTSVTGTSLVAISAINVAGTGTATLAINVLPLPPAISSPTTATAIQGTLFTYDITATHTPTSYGASGLPSNLSVNTTTGVISGTASSTGTSNVTISASNAGGTGSATLVLTVHPPAPVITSSTSATATKGSAFTYNITATNSPTHYGASGLPSGLTVNTTTGAVTGTATATGTSNVAISAVNVTGTGTATLVLTVLPPPPVITSGTSATATKGVLFSYQITASNSPSSFGAAGLPSGLSMNASGLISGTATATGTSNVNISATNAGGTGNATLVLIVLPPPPAITSATSAIGTEGSPFSYQITATNSPSSFGASGLPSGLIVNASGLISGTPASTGTTNITISATNAGGTGNGTLTLTVLPPPPVITSGSSATATLGVPFSYQIVATNSPSSFGAAGLPPGFSVDPVMGVISGTATATGTSNVTITAANVSGTGSATLFLTVLPPAPVITSGTIATATQGQLFTYQITAVNGPTSYSAAGLPPGLTVDPVMGIISGTATATGTSNVTISAANLGGTGSAILALSVLPPPPVITSGTCATATQGQQFTYQIIATNGPTGYAATGLPPGLTVDPVMGVISGTATTTGTSDVALSAVNLGGSGSAILVLNVVPPPPVITSGTSAMATEGQPFTYQITATNGPTTYMASGLPAGLNIDPSTGLISGTATATVARNVTIAAVNIGGTGTASLALLVQTPYAAWQNSMFTQAQLSDPAISGDMATPAGDGIPNLLKYALNLNPWVVSNSGLPVGSLVTTGSGNYLTLTYPEVLSATDITYTVQVSSDLMNWNSGPGYTDPPTPEGASDGVTQLYNVQAALPASSAPVQFIRLQVTGP